MNAPEIKMIPRIEAINEYLDSSIEEINRAILNLPEKPEKGWEELNELFLSQLR